MFFVVNIRGPNGERFTRIVRATSEAGARQIVEAAGFTVSALRPTQFGEGAGAAGTIGQQDDRDIPQFGELEGGNFGTQPGAPSGPDGIDQPPVFDFPAGDRPPAGSTGETAFETGRGDLFPAFIRGLEGNIGRSLGGPFQSAGDQLLRRTFDPLSGIFRGNTIARSIGQTAGSQASSGIGTGPAGESFEDFVRRRGTQGLGSTAAGLFRNLLATPRASFAFDPGFIDPQESGDARDAIRLAQSALGSQISPLLAQNSTAFRDPGRLFQEFRTGTGGGSGNFLEFLRSRLGLGQIGF